MKNKTLRVAKKEFLDMIRDKRSLIRMMVIPLVAFPIIINLVTKIQSSQSEKAAKEELTVGYILNGQDTDLVDRLSEEKNFKFKAYEDSVAMRDDVVSEDISAGLIFNKEFDASYGSDKTAKLNIIYRGTDMEQYGRLKEILDEQNHAMTNERLQSLDLDTSLTQAFNYDMPISKDMSMAEMQEIREFYNVSDDTAIIAKYAGGLLPYIFIAFCFMGCMYPAIDLFAGEKERGTMETLLTSPVNRKSILMGKMVVIIAFGLLSATLALIGLIASLNMVDASDKMMSAVNSMLTGEVFITLYILLIPLTIFFAGVMAPISIYAKSYKEAQSIMVPLNIVMVLPAIAGFIPSVELDYVTAFIPIVNVVLATKQILGGNMDMVLIGITFISLIMIAVISLVVSHKQFGKESNILRGE